MLQYLANNWYVFLFITIALWIVRLIFATNLKAALNVQKLLPKDIIYPKIPPLLFATFIVSITYSILKWTTIVAIILALINYSR